MKRTVLPEKVMVELMMDKMWTPLYQDKRTGSKRVAKRQRKVVKEW